jgi:PKD repeat protein
MKKIATIILILFSFIGISTNAQTTACNADFNLNYQSGNTIQFIPVMAGTASTTQHYWLFGDGGVSNEVSPVHTYLLRFCIM